MLLIVDQAEELITLSGRAEREALVGLLTNAVEEDPQLWIIVVMRSEFLTAFWVPNRTRCSVIHSRRGALGGMALLEVIEQPARRAGLVFDPPVLCTHGR